MKFTMQLLTIAIGLVLSTVALGASPKTDVIGWYFDEAATQRCADRPLYGTVIAYLCITNPSSQDCIAWELQSEATGDCAVTWNMQGTGINIATPPEFIVGLNTANKLTANAHNVIVLCTATIRPLDEEPIALYVGPSSMNEMQYLSSITRELRPLTSVAGDASEAVAWVNSGDWPCASTPNVTPVYMRTAPGLIDIANPLGGDVIANIVVNSGTLDSLFTAYQVPEVRKYCGALPDTLIVENRGLDTSTVLDIYRDYYVISLPTSQSPAAFASAASAIDGVFDASLPDTVRYEYLPNDPELGYHITDDIVDVQHAWDLQRASNVVVAIVDSGIDQEHSDFLTNVSGEWGYIENESVPEHGTGVAGLVGAIWNNGAGTSGMAQCNLLNKKLAVHEGAAGFCDKLADIMANSNAAIVNFSGSIPTDDRSTRSACDELYNSNRLLVAAAGSDGGSGPVYPAYFSSVLAVGGINRDLAHDPYSRTNTNIDLVAPSVEVLSSTVLADPEGDAQHCKFFNGTSFAAPIVSGAAALLLSYNPQLYNDDVIQLLEMSARTDILLDPYPHSYAGAYGKGLVRVGAALDSLLTNALVSGTATGFDSYAHSAIGLTSVYGLPAPGAPVGSRWYIDSYLCYKHVDFPAAFVNTPHVWGRGASTTGVDANWSTWPHVVRRKHHVTVMNVTTTGCTLKAYTFRFVDANNPADVRWFPADVANMQWGYAALGRDGVTSVPTELPDNGATCLEAFPNPFNANTTLRLALARASQVDAAVFDIRGARVVTLFNGLADAGVHLYSWQGVDGDGRLCPSAVYHIRAVVDGEVLTKSIALVK